MTDLAAWSRTRCNARLLDILFCTEAPVHYGWHVAREVSMASDSGVVVFGPVVASWPAICDHPHGATCIGFGLDQCVCVDCGVPVRSAKAGEAGGRAGWISK